jgi:uncharacterized C2H2 Zn-finger protein
MSETEKAMESSQEFWARMKSEELRDVADGTRCFRCKAYLPGWGLSSKPGYKKACYECAQIDTPDEVRNCKFIRCPKCGHSFNPFDGDPGDFSNDILRDGESDVICGQCDHQFEVTTNVSYTWDSPPRIEEEPEPEDEESDDDGSD